MMYFSKVVLLLWCSALSIVGFSQTSNISGIINNTSTVVNSINVAGNFANVDDVSGFSLGDTVLLIQMKGATIDISNSANFGNLTNLNNAGNYEFNVICEVDGDGSDIIFQNNLLNTYDSGLSAGIQLIRVPTYENAIVSGTLTANDWNGSLGGVLVFQTRGWLRMRPGVSINMDSKGFVGGNHQIVPDGCGCAFSGDPQFPSFYYPLNSADGAPKGEGIADFTAGREAGKGKQANGGGGGNDHNGGGGGGGNVGIGGEGGQPCTTRSCFFGQYCRGLHPGVGALGLSSAIGADRVFLGGGGGAGDDNGGAGSGGTAGGGIIIILSDSIFGNNSTLVSRGTTAITGAGDGVGGGGAGGSIIINTRAFHPSSAMNVRVNGGNGGSSSWSSVDYNSKGKGGGGGGGFIGFADATASFPPNLTTNILGGAAGSEISALSACFGSTGGATPGGNGLFMIEYFAPVGFNPFPVCVLPVQYSYLNAEKAGSMAQINWSTQRELNSLHFEVERSSDGKDFSTIGQVASRGDQGSNYSFTDASPHSGTNFYRLRQVDVDGQFQVSKTLAVIFGDGDIVLTKMYPNPVQKGQPLNMEISIPSNEAAQVEVLDVLGKSVYRNFLPLGTGVYETAIPTSNWNGGVYFLKITTTGNQQMIRRVVVME